MLTKTEEKISLLFWKGLSTKEVATAVYREVCTIKRHEHNIYVKLGINNRAELMRYLVEEHFKIDTSSIKRRIMAIACMLFVFGLEFSQFPVFRAKTGKPAAARVRTAKPRNSKKTYQYA